MPTERKSESARRNGAKSRGPVTDEGKRTSSRNALKHGIHSTDIVLPNEDARAYQQLLAGFLAEWQPATPTEETLVTDMVNARWRLQRIERLVAATIEHETARLESDLETFKHTMTTEAMFSSIHMRNASGSNTLNQFERWEGRLHQTFHRALKTLRSLQTERKARAEQDRQPPSEPAQFENRQNEPTGAQLAEQQLLADLATDRNGHHSPPLQPAAPDGLPPKIPSEIP